jgi:CRP/FNR family transcriptional regulator
MTSEILGLNGIVDEIHSCDALALVDSEVCVMPFSRIEEISQSVRSLQNHMHKIMSREIVKDQSVMMLLGGMRAEKRLAVFFMNLIQRLSARGFSNTELILRMTREEIINYLGMKLETVSQTLSKFADEGLIEVHQKHLLIKKPDELKKIAVPSPDKCN